MIELVKFDGDNITIRDVFMSSRNRGGRKPSWDEYFLYIAMAAAERSTCRRRKVGAVIVDRKNRISGTGYNGSAPGMPHCEPYHCNEENNCLITIHAEINALLNCNKSDLEGCTIYTTSQPCLNCLKAIRQAGIVKVVYLEAYKVKEEEKHIYDLYVSS